MEEGKIRTIKQICKRETCEQCGKPATWQLTFLLKNARSNPASKAYGRDDCSYCSDEKMFVCDKCAEDKYKIARDLDMDWCSAFPFKNFRHLFLNWKEIKDD